MKTRKYLFFIIIAIFSLAIVSCEDFLELDKPATYTDDTYYNDQQSAYEVVTACYDIWQNNWSLAYYIGVSIPAELRSDDVEVGGNPNWGPSHPNHVISDLNIISTSQRPKDIWEYHYSGIWRCNVAVEKINSIPDKLFETGIKNQLLGEAKYLRALHYSNLVKSFGGVPLVTRQLTPNDFTMKRATKEEIYSFLKDELEFCVEYLPLKAGTEAGRATKGAAIYLLTNILVFEAGTNPAHPSWEEAYNISKMLVTAPYGEEYILLDDYGTIWMEGNDFNAETIFEIVANAENNDATWYPKWLYPRAVKNGEGGHAGCWGWGHMLPTQDLVDEFETNEDHGDPVEWEDPRLHYSIWREGDLVPIGKNDEDNLNDTAEVYLGLDQTSTGYFTKKYWLNNEPEEDVSSINIKVFRYSDLLLYHAEAAYYMKKEVEARDILNKVRARARQGNPDNVLPDVTASGEELLQAIWHERRVELCMEHQRFWDLVRQDRAGEVLRAFGKSFVDGKHDLLPIPQEEIDFNPNLEQNPGY